jgi:hypothetical protein
VNSRQKNFKCRSIARGFKLVTWERGSVKDANKLCFFTRSCITHFVLRYKRIWYNTTTTHYMKRTTVKRHHLPQHTTTGARNQHWTTGYAHHPSDLPPTTAKEASKANLRNTPPRDHKASTAPSTGESVPKASTLSTPTRPGKAYAWHNGAPPCLQGLHHLPQWRKNATEAHRDSHRHSRNRRCRHLAAEEEATPTRPPPWRTLPPRHPHDLTRWSPLN